jgi:hypothetical protein
LQIGYPVPAHRGVLGTVFTYVVNVEMTTVNFDMIINRKLALIAHNILLDQTIIGSRLAVWVLSMSEPIPRGLGHIREMLGSWALSLGLVGRYSGHAALSDNCTLGSINIAHS